MSLRCFLATESVRGVRPLIFGTKNNGSLSEPGIFVNMVLNAVIGQRGECPRAGMETVATSLLFCMVLDHFTSTTAPFDPSIISPRASCLVLSKEVVE